MSAVDVTEDCMVLTPPVERADEARSVQSKHIETKKTHLSSSSGVNSSVSDGFRAVAVAGMLSGLAKTVVSHPLDTVKVHVQNRIAPPRNPSLLFRGISVPLVRNGVENSLHFLFRAVTASVLSAMSLHGAASNAFAVGFLSGFPQALFNTPADYIRLQLQLGKMVRFGSLFRGLPWVAMKEAASGAVFFGAYEGIKGTIGSGAGAGFAGSMAALMAMISTFPLDTLKTRVQAGGSVKAAIGMGKVSGGLHWAVLKCICGNFVALTVFEAAKKWDLMRRHGGGDQESAAVLSRSKPTERRPVSTARKQTARRTHTVATCGLKSPLASA